MADTSRTEADLTNNIFPDNQTAGSITAQDMRDFVVSGKYNNGFGWDFHLDGQYTFAAKRAIGAGVRTQITIDGALGSLGKTNNGTHQHFWDTANNKIAPNGLNNFGIVRLAMTGWSDGGATNNFDIELDVGGGSFPVIYRETAIFAKGATNTQYFNFIIPLFSGPDFQANGGTIWITPESNASFWEFAITAHSTFIARP